jgi:hypothetical protein
MHDLYATESAPDHHDSRHRSVLDTSCGAGASERNIHWLDRVGATGRGCPRLS